MTSRSDFRKTANNKWNKKHSISKGTKLSLLSLDSYPDGLFIAQLLLRGRVSSIAQSLSHCLYINVIYFFPINHQYQRCQIFHFNSSALSDFIPRSHSPFSQEIEENNMLPQNPGESLKANPQYIPISSVPLVGFVSPETLHQPRINPNSKFSNNVSLTYEFNFTTESINQHIQ